MRLVAMTNAGAPARETSSSVTSKIDPAGKAMRSL